MSTEIIWSASRAAEKISNTTATIEKRSNNNLSSIIIELGSWAKNDSMSSVSKDYIDVNSIF